MDRVELKSALKIARFTPPFNVCALCHHGGWDHSLSNYCLIEDCRDYFSSMTEEEQWEFGLDIVEQHLTKRDTWGRTPEMIEFQNLMDEGDDD